MKIEFNSNLPIYIQIMNYIKKKIVSGELNGGDKLPSVRELSQELTVNPNTIQRTYQELEREDLAYTKRGMGRFVTEDESVINKMKVDMSKEVMYRFITNMKQLGFNNDEIVKLVSKQVEMEE